MRTLYLLRHAKSDWGDPAVADRDRPLNARGRRDAPRIGRLLARETPAPEFILCSPAVRTRQTLDLLCRAMAGSPTIRLDERIYDAPVGALMDALTESPDSAPAVLLVGHNPGIPGLIERLTGEPVRVPTATLARIELDADRWSDLAAGAGRLMAVWRPEELDDD